MALLPNESFTRFYLRQKITWLREDIAFYLDELEAMMEMQKASSELSFTEVIQILNDKLQKTRQQLRELMRGVA